MLVKGGHLGGAESVDILVQPGSEQIELRAPRIPSGERVHGTGCALASAIAAHLALGRGLAEACQLAKDFVHERIADPQTPGRGAPAIV